MENLVKEALAINLPRDASLIRDASSKTLAGRSKKSI